MEAGEKSYETWMARLQGFVWGLQERGRGADSPGFQRGLQPSLAWLVGGRQQRLGVHAGEL